MVRSRGEPFNFNYVRDDPEKTVPGSTRLADCTLTGSSADLDDESGDITTDIQKLTGVGRLSVKSSATKLLAHGTMKERCEKDGEDKSACVKFTLFADVAVTSGADVELKVKRGSKAPGINVSAFKFDEKHRVTITLDVCGEHSRESGKLMHYWAGIKAAGSATLSDKAALRLYNIRVPQKSNPQDPALGQVNYEKFHKYSE